jgi:hypothetical protein
LQRAEAGGAVAANEERRQRLVQLQIDDLAADVRRLARLSQKPGLSAECRQLMKHSAERKLEEGTALRYGRRFAPTGAKGKREVRTFSAVYATEENKGG